MDREFPSDDSNPDADRWASLMKRAADGDSDARWELTSMAAAAAARSACRILWNTAPFDEHDLRSTVATRILGWWERSDADGPYSLRAFAMKTAWNAALDQRRRERRRDPGIPSASSPHPSASWTGDSAGPRALGTDFLAILEALLLGKSEPDLAVAFLLVTLDDSLPNPPGRDAEAGMEGGVVQRTLSRFGQSSLAELAVLILGALEWYYPGSAEELEVLSDGFLAKLRRCGMEDVHLEAAFGGPDRARKRLYYEIFRLKESLQSRFERRRPRSPDPGESEAAAGPDPKTGPDPKFDKKKGRPDVSTSRGQDEPPSIEPS